MYEKQLKQFDILINSIRSRIENDSFKLSVAQESYVDDGLMVKLNLVRIPENCKTEECNKKDAERFRYLLAQIPCNLSLVFCGENLCSDEDIIEAIDLARYRAK